MKKIILSLLIIVTIVLVYLFYPRKLIQSPTEISEAKVTNNDDLKQSLILSFKDYRESIYKIKQIELLKAAEKKTNPKEMKPEVCVKVAYDLDAFIMRARLRPKAIERKDCQKLGKVYQELSFLAPSSQKPMPSYKKRLEKDLAYFSEELNKQEWKSEDLAKKIRDFQLEIVQNKLKFKKISRSQKTSPKPIPKCMKTILMHKKEYQLTCKA